jgi:hypothetical protein
VMTPVRRRRELSSASILRAAIGKIEAPQVRPQP